MFQWIVENAGTIVVSIALIALVTGIVIRMRKDRKQIMRLKYIMQTKVC